MSLYSALTQILAPFAAKIKGIQTGYDGTEYDSPGEAVREQINDLHVLIGHVPGEAIQASAVAYNDSNVAAELTTVNGRLQQVDTVLESLEVTSADVNIGPWAQGYIRDNGTNGPTTLLCRTNAFLQFPGLCTVGVAEGYKYKIFRYSSNTVASFVEIFTGWTSESKSISFDAESYYRFTVGKTDGTDIAPEDIPANAVTYNTASMTDKTLTASGKAADAETVGKKFEKIDNNLFDSDNYNSIAAYPNGSTKVLTSNTNTFSVYIPCLADTFYTVTKRQSARFAVAALPDVPSGGGICSTVASDNTGTTLTIKTGSTDQYLLVFCYNMSTDTLTRDEILNSLKIEEGVAGNSIIQTPYSVLPSDIVNTMSYKPMAKPTKGYMCLVSDDGMAELATYALPMVISKDVPLTLAVMSSSEVFDNGTMQATVLDAVQNHGCEIAQHGGVDWTTYNELRLRQFITTETAFFSNLGLEAKSAVIPAHKTTPLIKAVMGGTFGVVRSGYKGKDADGNSGTIDGFYDYYTSGEGSNLYGLSSFNLADGLTYNKAAIDYANANNKVLIVYWHENSLTSDTKAVIEESIDYAKSVGLEFVTLDKLDKIIDLERDNSTL